MPSLLSFTFNTDGVKIFKSAKSSSLWPIFVVINEIPKQFRFRKENIVLAGLWHGKEPDFSIFFKYFIEEVDDINKKGFSVTVNESLKLKFNVRATMLSTDTPAKSKVLNCLLFNGYYGCPYCLHPGQIDKQTMRYPYVKAIQQRSHATVLEDAMEAMELRTAGKSTVHCFYSMILMSLEGFQSITCTHAFTVLLVNC